MRLWVSFEIQPEEIRRHPREKMPFWLDFKWNRNTWAIWIIFISRINSDLFQDRRSTFSVII